MSQSVARNKQYRRGGLGLRQRHNERQNEDYMNDDIMIDRAAYNVHFKEPQGSYESAFDKMCADGVISTRGLGKDPFIVDELIFDVNTSYFESGGGYDYAVSFFEEAYRCAVEEIGGEEYVLSAVMHADERNKAVSEQLGRDVYHYHLHVVYVPVVDKEVYFKKNNKDPEKAGKLREVIKQVSHSKKWPKLKQFDENGEVVRNEKGKAVLVNSYSLLQDHFHEHMTQAGFLGFERGERKSTREHLSDVEYKTQQETKRAAAMTAVVEEKTETAAALDVVIGGKKKEAAQQQKQLDGLNAKTAVAEKVVAELEEIEKIGHSRTITGAVIVPSKLWDKILNLIKEVFKSRDIIKGLRKKVNESAPTIAALEKELAQEKRARAADKASISDILEYNTAKSRAPRRLAETIADIRRQPPEKQRQDRAVTKSQSHTI